MAWTALVLGGAASGKSLFAECLASACRLAVAYVATARPVGAEMRRKIAAHRARRPAAWTTVEAPDGLAAALGRLEASRRPVVALVDSVSMWLAGRVCAGGANAVLHEVAGLCDLVLPRRAGPTILVADETGLGIVPAHRLGRAFREVSGAANQLLAARADVAVLLVAGRPLVLKAGRGTGALLRRACRAYERRLAAELQPRTACARRGKAAGNLNPGT